MYHLKTLQQSGLVDKVDARYRLSAEGKRYIDRANADNLLLREQARIAALIICKHPRRRHLYIQRNSQPAFGYLGFPLVDIPIDFTMPIADYVATRFQTMTGLQLSLTHRADGYINLWQGGQLEGSLLAHVMCAEASSDQLQLADQTHDYIWENDAAFNPEKLLASCSYLLNLLDQRPGHFFFEYSFSLDSDKQVFAHET